MFFNVLVNTHTDAKRSEGHERAPRLLSSILVVSSKSMCDRQVR